MIRKQLYLEETQNRALKRRAKALGVSEAEVVRAALDVALRAGAAPAMKPALPGRERALLALLDGATEIARSHRTVGARFTREELYEERESRWAGPT